MTKGYIEVEFLQHCLSCGNRGDGDTDKFQRASDGSIIWSQSWWHAVLTKAKQELDMDVIVTDMAFSLSITAETGVYRRRYSGKKFRNHEAIKTGTQVRFDFALKNAVTMEELTTMMTHIGEFIGISPYGYNLGYGKFKVIDVVSL